MAHIDSWEVGSQNWTPRMREEFQKRRGYDLLPLLPTFTGRVVDGAAQLDDGLAERTHVQQMSVASGYQQRNTFGQRPVFVHVGG